eukprot:Clim_evm20s154 gene=Clim_evmTU20s154
MSSYSEDDYDDVYGESNGTKRNAADHDQEIKPAKRRKGGKRSASGMNAVFCLCRQAEDSNRTYVACDKCNGWFHVECVGLQEAAAEKAIAWYCPGCMQSDATLRIAFERTAETCAHSGCNRRVRQQSKYCSVGCAAHVAYMRLLAGTDSKVQEERVRDREKGGEEEKDELGQKEQTTAAREERLAATDRYDWDLLQCMIKLAARQAVLKDKARVYLNRSRERIVPESNEEGRTASSAPTNEAKLSTEALPVKRRSAKLTPKLLTAVTVDCSVCGLAFARAKYSAHVFNCWLKLEKKKDVPSIAFDEEDDHGVACLKPTKNSDGMCYRLQALCAKHNSLIKAGVSNRGVDGSDASTAGDRCGQPLEGATSQCGTRIGDCPRHHSCWGHVQAGFQQLGARRCLMQKADVGARMTKVERSLYNRNPLLNKVVNSRR